MEEDFEAVLSKSKCHRNLPIYKKLRPSEAEGLRSRRDEEQKG